MQMVVAFMTHNPHKRTGCYVNAALFNARKRREEDKVCWI
jgi:hypothetical protein